MRTIRRYFILTIAILVCVFTIQHLYRLAISQPFNVRLKNPGGEVLRYALANDGQTLAVSYTDTSIIRIWDIIARGDPKTTILTPLNGINFLYFTPDRQHLLAAQQASNTIATYGFQEKSILNQITLANRISLFSLAPSGQYMAVAQDRGQIEIRRFNDYDLVACLRTNRHDEFSHDGHQALAFSPKNDQLIAYLGTDDTVIVQNWKTGQVVQSFVCHPSYNNDGSVRDHPTSFTWSPDGQTLAIAPWGKLQSYSLVSGQPMTSYPVKAYAHNLAYSADGQKLAYMDHYQEGPPNYTYLNDLVVVSTNSKTDGRLILRKKKPYDAFAAQLFWNDDVEEIIVADIMGNVRSFPIPSTPRD